jgi:hypothetical protein
VFGNTVFQGQQRLPEQALEVRASRALVVSLTGATTTATGLAVTCVIDESKYETGITITDEEFDSLNIITADFHGKWNYSVAVCS